MPVWRPPPPMPSERPQPVPTVPKDEEDLEMAHDWGHLLRQGVGAFFPDGGGFGGGGATGFGGPPSGLPTSTELGAPVSQVTGGLGPEACEGMIWTGAAPPKGYKVVNWCGRGVLRKVRRRRRRRILTASDKADISYIISTAGKGQLAASLIHKSTH